MIGQPAHLNISREMHVPLLQTLRQFDNEPMRLENVLAAHFEALPVPCRLVMADGTVVRQSRSLHKLLRPSAGRSCCESLGVRHDANCPSARTVKSGKAQCAWRWLGGIHVAIETTPIQDASGSTVASFECFRDITIEKRLESALTHQQELLETINKAMIESNHHLEEAQVELEKKNALLERVNEDLRSLDRLKDEFISVVSHELKAPLTSIKASVELVSSAEQQHLSPRAHQLLSICQRNIERLQRLVQDLLDIARIESGRLTLSVSCFPCVDAISECLQAVSALALQKGIILQANVDNELEIEADRDRLIQVLVNLLNNAIKFTDHGSVTLSVHPADGQIEFRVTDTGPGIPLEHQARIFDKFSQLSDPLNRQHGGSGLGLSIARGIAREHGGDITLVSDLGQGSCFTVSIPQPPLLPDVHRNAVCRRQEVEHG